MKRLMPAGFFQTDTGSVPNSDAYLWTHHNIIFLYHPDYGKAFPLFWGKCYCDASVQSGKLSMLTTFLSLTKTHTYKPNMYNMFENCFTCNKNSQYQETLHEFHLFYASEKKTTTNKTIKCKSQNTKPIIFYHHLKNRHH